MKDILIYTILIIGIVGIIFLAGMWVQYERMKGGKVEINYRVVERIVELPPKIIEVKSKPVTGTSAREALVDSLYREARKKDSVEVLFKSVSKIMEAVIVDTISVVDTVGSFYAERTNTIQADPISRDLSIAISYANARFRVVEKEIERYIPAINYWQYGWLVVLLGLCFVLIM